MNKIIDRKYIVNEDIIQEPNDILNKECIEVIIPMSTEEESLLKIMYNHVSNSQNEDYANRIGIRSAVGIAASQLGVLKQMLAIKTTDENGKIYKYMIVNPRYTYKSKQMCYLNSGEGCLSVNPGKYNGITPRHYEIEVQAYNLFNKKEEKIRVKGYIAIVLQHEIDHLHGKLYIDHINKLDSFYINESWIEV